MVLISVILRLLRIAISGVVFITVAIQEVESTG